LRNAPFFLMLALGRGDFPLAEPIPEHITLPAPRRVDVFSAPPEFVIIASSPTISIK
jgi:hypothetical protein